MLPVVADIVSYNLIENIPSKRVTIETTCSWKLSLLQMEHCSNIPIDRQILDGGVNNQDNYCKSLEVGCLLSAIGKQHPAHEYSLKNER